ncbi:MAG: hypothetical protein ACK56I_02500, partial [bacterium]
MGSGPDANDKKLRPHLIMVFLLRLQNVDIASHRGESEGVAGLVFILHSPPDDTRWKFSVILTDAKPALLKMVSLIKLFLAGNALLKYQDFQESITENTPNAEV